MLVAKDLQRHHGAQAVLGGVSLSVTEGTRLGIVGPNGVGKSTLLRVLAGLEVPDAGTVERAPATTTVGFLPQEPDAQPGETLRAYLARRTGVAAAGAHAHAAPGAGAGPAWIGVLALAAHTVTYFAVSASIAWVVYVKVGLGLLRSAWINLDWLWAGALVLAGVFVLGSR